MRCASVLLLCVTASICLGTDAITLKDGTILRGKVLRYEKGKFTVDEGGEKPRSVRTTDIENVEFSGDGAVPSTNPAEEDRPKSKPVKPTPAAQRAALAQAALEPLQGDDLDAWKLARSYVIKHPDWNIDNALPIRDAIQTTAAGDYVVAIPVISKPEPGLAHVYGIFLVEVATFGTTLRAERHEFRETNGPFRPAQPRVPQRRAQ